MKVYVGGRVVGEGFGVDVNTVGVDVSVSVGREAATVDGTSIPVNKSAVAPVPMSKPIPRNLMSVCKRNTSFQCEFHSSDSNVFFVEAA